MKYENFEISGLYFKQKSCRFNECPKVKSNKS